jgi:hypothetical protein
VEHPNNHLGRASRSERGLPPLEKVDSSPIRPKTKRFSGFSPGRDDAENKGARRVLVIDFIFDTEEVDGSSPFGPTILRPADFSTCDFLPALDFLSLLERICEPPAPPKPTG